MNSKDTLEKRICYELGKFITENNVTVILQGMLGHDKLRKIYEENEVAYTSVVSGMHIYNQLEKIMNDVIKEEEKIYEMSGYEFEINPFKFATFNKKEISFKKDINGKLDITENFIDPIEYLQLVNKYIENILKEDRFKQLSNRKIFEIDKKLRYLLSKDFRWNKNQINEIIYSVLNDDRNEDVKRAKSQEYKSTYKINKEKANKKHNANEERKDFKTVNNRNVKPKANSEDNKDKENIEKTKDINKPAVQDVNEQKPENSEDINKATDDKVTDDNQKNIKVKKDIPYIENVLNIDTDTKSNSIDDSEAYNDSEGGGNLDFNNSEIEMESEHKLSPKPVDVSNADEDEYLEDEQKENPEIDLSETDKEYVDNKEVQIDDKYDDHIIEKLIPILYETTGIKGDINLANQALNIIKSHIIENGGVNEDGSFTEKSLEKSLKVFKESLVNRENTEENTEQSNEEIDSLDTTKERNEEEATFEKNEDTSLNPVMDGEPKMNDNFQEESDMEDMFVEDEE